MLLPLGGLSFVLFMVSFLNKLLILSYVDLNILPSMISSFISYLRNPCLPWVVKTLYSVSFQRLYCFTFSYFDLKIYLEVIFVCTWRQIYFCLCIWLSNNFLCGMTFWKDHLFPFGIVVTTLSPLDNYLWGYF